MQGNVIEVGGLVAGTTAEDVAAIFKRCGAITSSKVVSGGDEVKIRVTFKTSSSATAAVQKFHNQPADGKILSVRIVGSTTTGTALGNRLGGPDLVRNEGTVDVLMNTDGETGSKMRSDSIMQADPRAQVLIAPPGSNPADYAPGPSGRGGRGGRRGRGRGRGWRRGGPGRQGGGSNTMDLD